MHISVIGDSLTKGVILSEGKYQELEEGFVNIVSREKGLALKNFSKFGSTVRYGHSVLTRLSAEISESDPSVLDASFTLSLRPGADFGFLGFLSASMHGCRCGGSLAEA